MINDDDDINYNNYFIIITCIIIYTIVLTSYIFWKKNDKKTRLRIFSIDVHWIEIIIPMIFLLKKIVSRHMQFLHLVNTRQYYLKIIISA